MIVYKLGSSHCFYVSTVLLSPDLLLVGNDRSLKSLPRQGTIRIFIHVDLWWPEVFLIHTDHVYKERERRYCPDWLSSQYTSNTWIIWQAVISNLLLLVLSPKTWWNLVILSEMGQYCWNQCGLKPTVQQRLFKSLYSVHKLCAWFSFPFMCNVQCSSWWNWAHCWLHVPSVCCRPLVETCCASPRCDTTSTLPLSSYYSRTSLQLSGGHSKIDAISLLLWNRRTPEHSTLISCFSHLPPALAYWPRPPSFR